MAYGVKDFDTIVSDIIAAILLRSSTIDDFSPGGVMRSFVEGVSIALDDFYMNAFLGFKDYLQNIQNYVFNFPKKTGVKAVTSVVFSRTDTSETATIDVGTRILTTTGLAFLTTEVGSIASGVGDSASIAVEAEDVGTNYNVGNGTITVIETAIPYVETVTNAVAATGGIAEESATAYKNRFKLFVEGLAKSNLTGLKACALGVEGITSASIEEHFPPEDTYNVTLYIDNGIVGGVDSEKIAEVQSLIDGDGTDDNPGYRSAGIHVRVVAPTVVTQNIVATIYMAEGISSDAVESQVEDAIIYYMASLGIGDNIIYNELINAIMEVYGVVDCDITTPSTNITINDDQVGRVGTFTLTLELYSE